MCEFINGLLLIDNQLIKQNFLWKDGKIWFNYLPGDYPQKDLKNLIVAPGFVDLHTHSRIPNDLAKETITSLTASALAGGFTTLVTMANVEPMPHDLINWKLIVQNFKQSPLKIIQVGKVTHGKQLARINELSQVTKIFSDDGKAINNQQLMKQALQAIKEVNGLILLHESDEKVKGFGYHSPDFLKHQIATFGPEYEVNLVKRDIALNRKINARIHIQHISCAETIDLILKAQANGMNITGELTPHHLYFNNSKIINNPNLKMNPPLSNFANQKKLQQAFLANKIQIIATDHAPHLASSKLQNWEKASNGVIGLETAFASLNTIFPQAIIQVLNALSINPAKLINLDIALKNGKEANLVIIDPALHWQYQKAKIKSLSKNSPWINHYFNGKVMGVIIKNQYHQFID